jgi:hypothetical protein
MFVPLTLYQISNYLVLNRWNSKTKNAIFVFTLDLLEKRYLSIFATQIQINSVLIVFQCFDIDVAANGLYKKL